MATTTVKCIVETTSERRQRQLLESRAEWPARLMSMLERATKFGWEIVAKDGKFIVGNKALLPVQLAPIGFPAMEGKNGEHNSDSTGCWCAMDALESALDFAEREQEEMIRRHELRKNALSKLAKEEREALGIYGLHRNF